MPFVGNASVIPCYVYVNPAFPGRQVSTGGARPHGDGWVTKQVGWTVRWQDGTTGRCKPPFKTEDEANEWTDRYNAERKARLAGLCPTCGGTVDNGPRDESGRLLSGCEMRHTS